MVIVKKKEKKKRVYAKFLRITATGFLFFLKLEAVSTSHVCMEDFSTFLEHHFSRRVFYDFKIINCSPTFNHT